MRSLPGALCLAMLPLAVWPGLERPFSLPKLLWLLMATVALVPMASIRASTRDAGDVPAASSAFRRALWLAAAWAVGFVAAALTAPLPSLEALALGLAAPAFALVLTRSTGTPAALLAGQVGAAK